MRCLVLTGKGGAGTTTVAAATAAHAARRGQRVLLVSTAGAAGWADVLGHSPCPSGPDRPGGDAFAGAPLEFGPGLAVAPFEPLMVAQEWWSALDGRLDRLWTALGVPPLEAEELRAVPGLAELGALAALRGYLSAGGFDAAVVDAGPVSASLPLLALPGTLAGYLTRLLPADSVLRRRRALAIGPYRFASGPASEGVERARQAALDALADLAALFVDPERVLVRVVVPPGRVAAAVSRRALRSLALHGVGVDAVIANRRPVAGVADTGRVGDAGEDGLLEAMVAPVPVLAGPVEPAEPVGLDALAALGASLYAGSDPLAARAGSAVPGSAELAPALERHGDTYTLAVPLPFTESDDVELARLGDDRLILTVGPDRRVLTLPSVLRRCATQGATLSEGKLVISFVPDPALWPRTPSGAPA